LTEVKEKILYVKNVKNELYGFIGNCAQCNMGNTEEKCSRQSENPRALNAFALSRGEKGERSISHFCRADERYQTADKRSSMEPKHHLKG
jgi:hypothetical protein